MNEGDMSRLRANMVKRETLYEIALPLVDGLDPELERFLDDVHSRL